MKTLRRISFIIFVTAVCLGLAYQILWIKVDPNKASTVIAAVHQRGAGWVVADALKNEKAWDIILDNIETGKPEWIEVYKTLVPSIEADLASDLISALSKALTKNPEVILPILSAEGSVLGPEKVCGALTDEEMEYLDVGVAALKAQMDSLNRVAKPELGPAKQKCLGQIQQVLAREIFR